MKALILQRFSKSLADAMVLADWPEPRPASGQVLVRMAAG